MWRKAGLLSKCPKWHDSPRQLWRLAWKRWVWSSAMCFFEPLPSLPSSIWQRYQSKSDLMLFCIRVPELQKDRVDSQPSWIDATQVSNFIRSGPWIEVIVVVNEFFVVEVLCHLYLWLCKWCAQPEASNMFELKYTHRSLTLLISRNMDVQVNFHIATSVEAQQTWI
jgi:hypothetical protein